MKERGKVVEMCSNDLLDQDYINTSSDLPTPIVISSWYILRKYEFWWFKRFLVPMNTINWVGFVLYLIGSGLLAKFSFLVFCSCAKRLFRLDGRHSTFVIDWLVQLKVSCLAIFSCICGCYMA
ncbi:hypothetical protein Peur_020422 [Populus x canadensis]